MTMFTQAELAYLRTERRLGRLATVGPDGTPHVTPVGWRLGPGGSVVEITGRNFAATKKFRDVARTHTAAIVIDDVQPPGGPAASRSVGEPKQSTIPNPSSASTPSASSPGASMTPSRAIKPAPCA